MLAFVRTANIAPGKMGAAVGFAKDVAAHIQSHHDVALDVLKPVGGNPSRVAWSARFKDLATYEVFMNKLAADKAYWELVGRGSDCFLPGSVNDALWATT